MLFKKNELWDYRNGYKLKEKQGFHPLHSNEISHGKVEMHTAPTERRGTSEGGGETAGAENPGSRAHRR